MNPSSPSPLQRETSSPSDPADDVSAVTVRTLDHVTLVVRDLEASRRFYCDFLGMTEVPRPGFTFPGKWFQAGGTQIHLILEYAESGPAGFSTGGVPKSSRNHHFAFQVDDASAAATLLRNRGIAILSGPKTRPDGFVQTFLTDPDGHVVELCSMPEK